MISAPNAQSHAIDPAHSTVEFSVRHLMISKVRGRFSAVSGTVDVPEGSNVPAAVQAVVQTGSIDTREEQRDAHLKSADFLDADTYPTLSFSSTRIEGSGDAFRMTGDLTIHGVTREVTFDGQFEGRGRDPWGNDRVGYEARATINRKDFGLTWNQALETGGVVVGDEIRIELAVEAIAQTPNG